ncbi:hypothetical protein FHT02_003760 [Sphingomonas xinjiangensis]|uniref:Uncharacterized protein n=1 Tax=Sphingomonas xinjiangensis TaxID=643568 RepID=A0A840YS56_9SPHN|nr:hypothetical protein [Sphingomonas xinjiangensis]
MRKESAAANFRWHAGQLDWIETARDALASNGFG